MREAQGCVADSAVGRGWSPRYSTWPKACGPEPNPRYEGRSLATPWAAFGCEQPRARAPLVISVIKSPSIRVARGTRVGVAHARGWCAAPGRTGQPPRKLIPLGSKQVSRPSECFAEGHPAQLQCLHTLHHTAGAPAGRPSGSGARTLSCEAACN